MGAISMRDVAGRQGISGDMSLLFDVFGFQRSQVPPDPVDPKPTVSWREHCRRLNLPHIEINVVMLGSENFTDADIQQLDYAVYKMRNIYSAAGVGVGRAIAYFVTLADADGLDSPTSVDDIETICEKWSVRNSAIDIFVPHNMAVVDGDSNLLGRSPVDGPCDDKNGKDQSGVVCGLWGSDSTARTMAHEVGHYLGLGHRQSQPHNLMCQTGKICLPGKECVSIRAATLIDGGQASTMRSHCMARAGLGL